MCIWEINLVFPHKNLKIMPVSEWDIVLMGDIFFLIFELFSFFSLLMVSTGYDEGHESFFLRKRFRVIAGTDLVFLIGKVSFSFCSANNAKKLRKQRRKKKNLNGFHVYLHKEAFVAYFNIIVYSGNIKNAYLYGIVQKYWTILKTSYTKMNHAPFVQNIKAVTYPCTGYHCD